MIPPSGLFSSMTITMCAGAGSGCAAATGAGPARVSAHITANARHQRLMLRSLGARPTVIGQPRSPDLMPESLLMGHNDTDERYDTLLAATALLFAGGQSTQMTQTAVE